MRVPGQAFLCARKGELVHYSASLSYAAVSFIGNLVAVTYLLPVELGIIQSVLLIGSYTVILDLGVFCGFFRLLPEYLGRDRRDDLQPLVDAAWKMARYVGGLGAVIGLGAVLYFWGRPGLSPLYYLAALGLLSSLVCTPFNTLLTMTHRGSQRFLGLGVIMHLQNAIFLVGSLSILVMGVGGLLLRNILVPLCNLGLLLRDVPEKPRRAGDWPQVRFLAATGLPLVMIDFLASVLLVSDRTMVALYFGAEDVGHYTLPYLVITGLATIPNAMGMMLFPKAAHQYGQTNRLSSLKSFYWLSLGYNVLTLLPVAAVAYWLIGPVTEHFFPRYSPGVAPARIMCLSSLFLAYVGNANILIVARKYLAYQAMLAGAIGVMFVGSWLAIQSGGTLNAVAWSRFGASALLCGSVLIYAYRLVHRSERHVP